MSKKAAPLVVGRTYFGPNDQRLIVTAIDGDKVTVMYPLSLRTETRTLAAMGKFLAGSSLRTYQKKRETRVKLAENDDEVMYRTLDFNHHRVPRTKWDKWRKTADA